MDTRTHSIAPKHLSRIFTGLRQWFSRNTPKKPLEEAVNDLVEAYEDDTALSKEEQLMLHNVFAFGKLTVQNILIPRNDIVAVRDDVTLKALVDLCVEEGHSRIPVYHDTIDHIQGFVHVKDILPLLAKSSGAASKTASFQLSKILRQVLFVPPSMHLVDLLSKMRAARVHMALVLDEYGGTEGLITIEDVVEKIIGHIEDEHDESTLPNIIAHTDNVFETSGRTPIEEVEKLLGVILVDEETREDCNTIGGLLCALCNKVPSTKEAIPHASGYLFTVLEADPRRVKRIKIEPLPEAREA